MTSHMHTAASARIQRRLEKWGLEHLPALAAEQAKRVFGMDPVAPFGVYVDGVQVGQHDTEAGAQAHYDRLTGRAHQDDGGGRSTHADEARAS